MKITRIRLNVMHKLVNIIHILLNSMHILVKVKYNTAECNA